MRAPLTPERRAELEANLADARQKLHSASTVGQKTMSRYGEQEYRLNPVEKSELKAYIVDLEGQLGIGGRVGARRVST
ncbi:gpW family head-tail joining protein [Caulobacter sp. 1776]|uniref:gpW family head-tail joining protein n=1 Tax=Caulobacter sp. 1776 TaxID=3156420 RepID=UPI003396E03A